MAVQFLHQAVQALGAECGAFASFIGDDDSLQSYRFLLDCDPRLCIEYERLAWYYDDPWLRYALRHTEPMLGEHIQPTTPAQEQVIELLQCRGFRSSVVVPAPSCGRLTRVGVLLLGSWTEDYFADVGYGPLKVAARGVAMEIHDWFVNQCRRELVHGAGLCELDLRLLAYEREGESSKQIAARLATSIDSVNSRFQRITAKLGVPTRKAAARFAAEHGLI